MAQCGVSEYTGFVGLPLCLLAFRQASLAHAVIGLPPLWSKTAVLLSVLSTGTAPFMLAEFYPRKAGVTSSAILFSTVVSLLTMKLCST